MEIKHHSDSVLKLTRDKMIADCQEIVDYLKGVDDTLDISASGWKSEGESILANNAGMFETDCYTHWSLGGGVQKTTGTDMLFAHAYRGWQEAIRHVIEPHWGVVNIWMVWKKRWNCYGMSVSAM